METPEPNQGNKTGNKIKDRAQGTDDKQNKTERNRTGKHLIQRQGLDNKDALRRLDLYQNKLKHKKKKTQTALKIIKSITKSHPAILHFKNN